ncbi:hypothetical protein CAOG_08147 [Capsaspora owczarzaki ATCC 30864]|uniref:Uncharacterized protein n=1 Tax=Capsaspora owczarzaki (strain ATCC 30864) TaxID=595528 RepID=A0A0D2WYQ1_CAPO3|nr:hypothetical protein CAOG_08147 [Capsaspora owczarzaki ATCC 30864]KJE98133.1 hypothetical protein CAOG_008147 [Capsaspora owczarzaki ATCC 30864]|eukprot:XP_004342748.2 hypothetical protein CAOG_08147 [Capsaspora owczarzaki ATCC 30864]
MALARMLLSLPSGRSVAGLGRQTLCTESCTSLGVVGMRAPGVVSVGSTRPQRAIQTAVQRHNSGHADACSLSLPSSSSSSSSSSAAAAASAQPPSSTPTAKTGARRKTLPDDGFTLKDFMAASTSPGVAQAGAGPDDLAEGHGHGHGGHSHAGRRLSSNAIAAAQQQRGSVILNAPKSDRVDVENIPYVPPHQIGGEGRKVFFETYGCQMNVNDTEIVWSILQGVGFERTLDVKQADVILLMTCAIRDNAERKVWSRLNELKHMRLKRTKDQPISRVGVLGCMAERLKTQLLEKDQLVDVVAGPDSYRDLPRLLSIANQGDQAVNVQLSLDETYADIAPVRMSKDSVTAFVSIMRGCDNMCSFCIVPFTRGRERSRPLASIVEEVRQLARQGVREVTLLGQNVNSYRDESEPAHDAAEQGQPGNPADSPNLSAASPPPLPPSAAADTTHNVTALAAGFKSIYKPKIGGRRFAELLRQVAAVDPEMRIRFTSPHPKDFPDDVLTVIASTANVCKSLHMPAQSGSTSVLERMRRGYSRESYLELVARVRRLIPDVTLSSDFIAGFCGETEADFKDTLDLIEKAGYEYGYLFGYSMREKTHAHRKLVDDVPADVKNQRLKEMIASFYARSEQSLSRFVGSRQLVLVERPSRRAKDQLTGRSDGNISVNIGADLLPQGVVERASDEILAARRRLLDATKPGEYLEVEITSVTARSLRGVPIRTTSLQDFVARQTASSSAQSSGAPELQHVRA